ncbi:hypothetical protein IMX26_08855 [Clostridium sp. 'deep sea']|uniref:hypothetical protein n=1 Tax=Clostridium sp. 'deep sea' TaxID=2779445 RepID=UPI00189699CB|nr:hypothetical protein [Clostridium sp. 'deep sea']QOR33617.1 hypothetical protein IMX26_08855 [Clostridium sp. 'deep sea']
MKKFTNVLLVILLFTTLTNLYNNLILHIRIDTLEQSLKQHVQIVTYSENEENNNNINDISKWINKATYSVTINDKSANLNFKIAVKEITKNEQLYLVLVNSQSEEQEYKLQKLSSFNYYINTKVNCSSYEAYIISKSGDKQRKEKLGYINTNKNTNILIEGDRYGIHKTAEDAFVEFYISVNLLPPKLLIGTAKKEDYKNNILEITAEVYMGLQKIGDIDLHNNIGYISKKINSMGYSYSSNAIYNKEFSGEYKISFKQYDYYQSEIKKKHYKDVEIYFLVKALDSHGNKYQKLVNPTYYKIDKDKIVKE